MDGHRVLPAVAQPAYNGYANIKTRKRRLQRKHTLASYRHMQTHLLSLVKPMPIGVFSADLESFRRSLYTEADANTEADEKLQTPCIRCDWCGIWTPLPPERDIITAKITEISGTSLELSLESNLAKLDSVVDTLLDACLCQSTLVEEIIDTEGYKIKRCALNTECFTAAEASELCWNLNGKPGLKKYCFKRSHPAVEDPIPVTERSANFPISPRPLQYSTDETTGECKSQ